MSRLDRVHTWLKSIEVECTKLYRALKPFPKTKREFYIRYSGISYKMLTNAGVKISDERLRELALGNKYAWLTNLKDWLFVKLKFVIGLGNFDLYKKYPRLDNKSHAEVLNNLMANNESLSQSESAAINHARMATSENTYLAGEIRDLKRKLKEIENAVPPTEEEIAERRALIKKLEKDSERRRIERNAAYYSRYGGLFNAESNKYEGEFISLLPESTTTVTYPVANLQLWGYTGLTQLYMIHKPEEKKETEIWAEIWNERQVRKGASNDDDYDTGALGGGSASLGTDED